MSTLLYQVPVRQVEDVQFTPPPVADATASTAGAASDADAPPSLHRKAPLAPAAGGVSVVHLTLDSPIILDALQLRGRAVQASANSRLQVTSVRARLHARDEWHTLPGCGYEAQAATFARAMAIDSSSPTGAVSARQRFRVCGLVKQLEITVQGNVREAPPKEDDTLLKKMDFGSFPLSPVASLDSTIHKTSSLGNRFTLPRLSVPISDAGLNDTGSSDAPSGLADEPLVFALFGFRLDSTPVHNHVITLLNMSTNIQLAQDAQKATSDATAANATATTPIAAATSVMSPFTWDLVELYQLTGLAMQNSRSFVSAADMFRKAKEQLAMIIAHLASGLEQAPDDEETTNQLRDALLRVSSLELLAADSYSEHEHLFPKLLALQTGIRFLQAALGPEDAAAAAEPAQKFVPTAIIPQPAVRLSSATDLQSGLLSLQPELLRLLRFHLRSTALPALQHSAYKCLGFVLEALGAHLASKEVARLLGAILNDVPITPSNARTTMAPNGNQVRADSDDEDSGSDVSFTSDSDDDDTQRWITKKPKKVSKSISISSDAPEFLASFPLLLTSIERARRTNAATQIADAFFRVLRSLLDFLPAYLAADEQDTGVRCFELVAQQVLKYMPASDIALASSASPPASSLESSGLQTGGVSFADFATALGATSTNNTASVNTAWIQFKTTLLQYLTVCAYTLQGELLTRTSMSSTIFSGGVQSHGLLFASLLGAQQDESEDIRKAATTAWCMLRDAYPVALAALLAQEHDEGQNADGVDAIYALDNVRGFVDLVVQTLTTPPSLAVSKADSTSDSETKSKTTEKEPMLPPFGNPFSSSPPPPSHSLSPASARSTGSSAIAPLPHLELTALMLDLVYKVASACSRALSQHRDILAADPSEPGIMLGALPVADEFARLTNFVTALVEVECTRRTLRSILLQHQYWTVLQLLVKLTRGVPLQLPTSAALEEVSENGASMGPITPVRPTLNLPIVPTSSLPSFQLRAATSLADAATYHFFLLPLLEVTCGHCEHSAPKEELLQLLVVVLSTVSRREVVADPGLCGALLALLRDFAPWIPHSVTDATFDLFNTLFALLHQQLTPSLLITLLHALTNKYTVRSAAYRYARDLFIQHAVQQLFAKPAVVAPAVEPTLHIDHLFQALLALPSQAAACPPMLASLAAPVRPVRSAQENTKGASGAGSREVEALEQWAARRFEDRKQDEARKELMSFVIQLLATLGHFVANSDLEPLSAAPDVPPSPMQLQRFHPSNLSDSSVSSPLDGLDATSGSNGKGKGYSVSSVPLATLLTSFGPPLVALCCTAITSAHTAQRLDAVVLAGLLSSLLAWLRARTAATTVHPLGALLTSFFQLATVRGLDLQDAELSHAGLVHSWAAVRAQRGLLQAGKTPPAALVSEHTALVKQLWLSAHHVVTSSTAALSVREFAQWVLLQLAHEASVAEHVLPTVLAMGQSKHHNSRLAATRILAAAARLLNEQASSGTAIPPALRSSLTPFVEAPTSIDSLSSLSDFSGCAADLDFFVAHAQTTVTQDADETPSAPKELTAPCLPVSVLALASWFDKPAASAAAASVTPAQQLKQLLRRLLRDWHGLVARAARVLYDFFDFSAKLQGQKVSSGTGAPMFHASLSTSEWAVFSLSAAFPPAALLNAHSGSLPAPAGVLFEWAQEAADQVELVTYSSVINGLLPGGAAPATSTAFDGSKADDLFEHISRVYQHALDAKEVKKRIPGMPRDPADEDADDQDVEMAHGSEDASWTIEAGADRDLWDTDADEDRKGKGKGATKKGNKAAAQKGKKSPPSSSPQKTAAQKLAALSPHAAWKAHMLQCFSIGEDDLSERLFGRLTASHFDALFFRAMRGYAEVLAAAREEAALDATVDLVPPITGRGSPTPQPKLGGASSMGASIAEELDRMVRALEQGQDDDDQDECEEENFGATYKDVDDDSDDSDSDEDEEVEQMALRTFYASKGNDNDGDLPSGVSNAADLTGGRWSTPDGGGLVRQSAEVREFNFDDSDEDDDQYEDEPLIDESELQAAAEQSSKGAKANARFQPPPVSHDFRSAVKHTAKEYIASLKTSSARPRKQQSAVSSSASAAASAPSSTTSPPKKLLGLPPAPISSKSPEGLGSTGSGWEGADPDDMGAATSRGSRKRPESAGRRRPDGPRASDEHMDQLDSIIQKHSLARDQARKGPQAVPHKVNIPKHAFALPLPISTAVSSSRPKSASVVNKPVPVKAIPVPMPLEQQVFVEEFYEEDDTPLGDYANTDSPPTEEVTHLEEGDVASDHSIHTAASSSPAVDTEEDSLTFSVHLASSNAVATPNAADDEDELNRSTSSTSSVGDPTTPGQFQVRDAVDDEDQDEQHHIDASELPASPPLRTRQARRGAKDTTTEAAPEEESDGSTEEDEEDSEHSSDEDYAAQMAEYDSDPGDLDEDEEPTPSMSAPKAKPAFSLTSLSSLALPPTGSGSD